MPEVAAGNLGPELSYDVSFTGGALQVSAKYGGAQASFALTGSISASALVAALAAKLTNPTEKAILGGLEAIISAIP